MWVNGDPHLTSEAGVFAVRFVREFTNERSAEDRAVDFLARQ
jgi:hypothetical protein